MTSRLFVYMAGRKLGHIDRDRQARLTLTYAPSYGLSRMPPLSPTLSPQAPRHQPERIEAYLDGLLPEMTQVRERWSRLLGTDTTPFGLLTRMGLDCAGAVQFTPTDHGEHVEESGRYEPISPEQIAARLAELVADEASWTAPAERWSLAGAQSKLALAKDGDAWLVAEGAAATTHIIKPGIRRMHSQALTEHITMDAARRLGLRVAASQFVMFGEQPAIVVERFDRYRTASGYIGRLHQVDFCQALGRRPRDKYEAEGGPTSKDVVDLLRRTSTDGPADVRSFSDSLIFNYLSGSPDGHAKNYALIYAGEQVRMAPLYDLATVLPYDRSESGLRDVAFSIGGRRRFGSVDETGWVNHARRLELPPDEVVARVTQLREAIPQAFEDALTAVDHPAAAQIGDRLLPTLGDLLKP